MFTGSTRTTDHTPTNGAGRRLDALAVEAALNGRRPYRALPAPEVAEVLRIRRRNGDTLDQVAELLDVDASVLAEQYAAAGPR
ncbi:hypothetical protein NLX83_10890 [Allokutzneria sp. A3M-2-11 16]|uniref:hypothetical protein n=1 Tax=Allokutzneria sp. A3M-2-11 16 TaxID=2962043 RepID=UPI0020B6B36C|nr:hypothetical protein [Allokutzneria sp. A3M-2-11 16]MCP3799764.1 hypothetical protein [Allokutzneria sp. A3M-2-11 16]